MTLLPHPECVLGIDHDGPHASGNLFWKTDYEVMPWNIGDRVYHPVHGPATVIGDDSGDRLNVQVCTDEQGAKIWVDLLEKNGWRPLHPLLDLAFCADDEDEEM